MKRVSSLPFGANGCAILPGRMGDPDGFVKTDAVHPYSSKPIFVSAEAVRIMAAEWGMVSRQDHSEVVARADDAEFRLHQAEQDLQEYDRKFAAIDVFESAGYTARKKTGRPKTTKAA